MKQPGLQLLVYGKDIRHLQPEIDYPGLQISRVITVSNPNYLFIDLRISPQAQAGTLRIHFKDKDQLVATHDYELWAREPGSAGRQGFSPADVMYLITPDRFANGDTTNDQVAGMKEGPDRSFKGGRHGGDIAGIRQHLDYIAGLGFTAVWLNPVLENDMPRYSYHGYSTTDYYRVDPRFGTNESYRQLSREARAKGIKLIMDMIVNHCGLEHWWMKDLPTPDWINQWPTYTGTNHRRTVHQDPHASRYDHRRMVDGWFVPSMPDLNQRNELMATYLTQNTLWWIEYAGLAGIRMDTYPYPDADYMAEWTRRVMEEYPNFNIVGEEWALDPAIVSYWQKGKQNSNGYTSELKSLMDFPLQHYLVEALTSEESWNKGWRQLYECLAKDFLYADHMNLVVFPDNHDMSRMYAQLNRDDELYRLAMTFFLTVRGIPQVYYGTEILMANPGGGDHGLIRADFPGGWPGDEVNAFTGHGLRAEQLEAREFVSKLLNWRKQKRVIHHGKLMHFAPEDGVYVYFRYDDTETLMVILNKNEAPYALALDRFAEMLGSASQGRDLFSGKTYLLNQPLDLPPRSPLVLELE